MKKLLKFAVCLALLVMVVALFTGCKATGGGSFMSCDNKCTFGFNAQGTETDGSWEFKGQFQFNDHNGNKFHVNKMSLLTVIGPVANFTGETKDGKTVNVTVTDLGEPGAGSGDLILIVVPGEGTWGGAVQGNIQVH
jgi:hypothetical protein